MAIADPPGWDVVPCWTTIQTVGHGGSPYAEWIVALKAYSNRSAHAAGDHAPRIFWYPPLTIPLLRVLAFFPGWFLLPLYCFAVAAGLLLQLKAGFRMASQDERRWLIFLLPFAVFFPGLLSDDIILSGNVAYVLYGLVLAAAISGWERNKWLLFYLAVLLASIFKTPMLTLLAFPILVGKRQWAQACITGAIGSILFAMQPLLWPAQFHEFLELVRMQFDEGHDFGFGPSGLLGKLLWDLKKPYSPGITIAYLAWAVALGTLLLAISFRVRRNPDLREMWIPIALVGTLLMDPRITEYGIAPLTIPLLLIAWRVLRLAMDISAQWRAGGQPILPTSPLEMAALSSLKTGRPDLALLLAGLGWFVAINVIAGTGEAWRPTALAVLLLLFSLSLWTLHHASRPRNNPGRGALRE